MSNINNYIEPVELFSIMHTDKSPIIIDTCRPAAFPKVPRLIASAFWIDSSNIRDWAVTISNDQPIIVNCVHGQNVSQLVASTLRSMGKNTRYVLGGVHGWEEAGGSTISRTKATQYQGKPWVTRDNPKIDRIACPWLIRRFIDPKAVFHFVETEWVQDIADEMGGMAFDIDSLNSSFTHKGDRCSFDAFIDTFDIRDPALEQMATIIRGADTAKFDSAPQSAGLMAMSLGLSAIYSDDLEMLEKGMVIYDALYAWCRSASDETHDWPSK